MNPLLRYIHPENGPIVHIESSLQPGFCTPFYWYTIARLSDDYRSKFGSRFSIPALAYGWDFNKQKSQEKAIQAGLILWAQKIYHQRDDYLGKNINHTDVGFAMLHSCSQAEVFEIAQQNAIHAWAKQQAIKNHQWRLRPGFIPLLNLNRFLFLSKRGKLFLLYAPIFGLDQELYFGISIFQFKSGECILGSGCAKTVTAALDAAMLENYARYRFINRVQQGVEQLLDKIELHRQWLFATDAPLGKEVVTSLLDRISSENNPWILDDPLLYSQTIAGPWDKDLILHRVLYTRSTETDNLYELPL